MHCIEATLRGSKELQKPSHVFLVIMHNTTIRDIYKRVGERRCELQFCPVSSNRCTQFLQDPEHCDSAGMVMVSKMLLWMLVVVMAVEVLSLESVSDDDEDYGEGSAVSDGSNWDDEDGIVRRLEVFKCLFNRKAIQCLISNFR